MHGSPCHGKKCVSNLRELVTKNPLVVVDFVTMWKTVKVFVVLSVFLCTGEANVVKRHVSKGLDISKMCYFCLGEKADVDNVAACSTNNTLFIEECSLEDHFDKCVVVQAFSLSKNTTIFKRECTSRRFCEERRICSDPDFSDCRYECCTGDLCNNFNFTDDVATKTPQPTVAMTTQKYQEVVEGGGEMFVTKNAGETTVAPEITTHDRDDEIDDGTTTMQRLSTTASSNNDQAEREVIVPVVEEGCQDLNDQCPSFADPANLPKFCKDNDQYTSIACRKSCRFCIPSQEVTTIKPETMDSTKSPNLQDCKDKRIDCRDLKTLGYCDLLPDYMEDECSETCGYCTGKTTTTIVAGAKKVMTSKLVFTEKVMTSQPIVTEKIMTSEPIVTEKVMTSESVVTERRMETTRAPVRSEIPSIEETTSERAKNYASTSTPNEVQSGVKFKPTLENIDCQDKRNDCHNLKKMDYCKLMFPFMNVNCRKTCGLCPVAANESTPESNITETPSPEPTTQMRSSTTSQLTTIKTLKPTTSPSTESLPVTTPAPAVADTTTKSTEKITQRTEPVETTARTTQGSIEAVITSTVLPQTTQETTRTEERTTEERTTESTTSGHTVKPQPSSVPDTEDCRDQRENCDSLKEMNYCKLMVFFMDKNCRKTCGFCLRAGNESTPESKTAETPSPEPSPEPSTEMTSSTTSQLTTIKTSKSTTSPSTESLPVTTPNPAVADTTTKSTEKITERTEPVETAARTTPNIIDIVITSTVLPQTTQGTKKPEERTAKPTSEPKLSTKKITVKPGPSSIPVTEDCYDTRKECATFAKLSGYCDYNKAFMMEHCRRSCGFCSPGNKTDPAPPKVTTKLPDVTSTTPDVTTTLTSRSTPVVTTETPTEPTTKVLPEDRRYEVVFVIGTREPNASQSFNQQKKIIQEILKKSTLTKAKYGLVLYADKGRINFRLAGGVPITILNELLNILPWQKDGSRVDKGIKKALQLFEDHPDSSKRIVAFINRPSDASYSELKDTREEVESKGVKLIVVGMGTGYDTGEFVTMAPRKGDQVIFDSSGSSDVVGKLEQAATYTIDAVMQGDDTSIQGGISTLGRIQILGPKNPETSKYGDTLRWKIWPWGKCVDGKQSRVVRCYHFYKDKDYHVIIHACIEHVAKMPAKEKSC